MTMALSDRLRLALRLPPDVVLAEGLAVVRRAIGTRIRRRRDQRHGTRASSYPRGEFARYFPSLDTGLLSPRSDAVRALAAHYLAHRFDLLGSGWVEVRYGMHCAGLEGHRYDTGAPVDADGEGRWLVGRISQANLEDAQKGWQLADGGYVPIDWQLDFKSGYRWSESTWYRDIVYGHLPGVDVKVPWELARMQHLPQLAWAHALSSNGASGFAAPQDYAREFRNQVLDFIATNPPRFGVNWCCTMDVAIRVANWLVAFDLLRAYGAAFDDAFQNRFQRSVYEHGRHILSHLEWRSGARNNHYLANIVGLLFVAAYLPSSPETDAWLAFSIRELIGEVGYQFTPDGANFEASTSYHRLSSEMVVYASAIILGLSPERRGALSEYDPALLKGVRLVLKRAPFRIEPSADGVEGTLLPVWYAERLERMAEFTMHITKPNGRVPQVGDNDSGRFLKLDSVYRAMSVSEAKASYANLAQYKGLPDSAVHWQEEYLDHRHLVAAVNGLFARADLTALAGQSRIETEIVQRMAGGIRLPSYRRADNESLPERVRVGRPEDWRAFEAEWRAVPDGSKKVVEMAFPGGNLRDALELFAYPDFGLYLFRSPRLYLAVRCGATGQRGRGGHAHNDQLSVELSVDGQDEIVDPGTYLYTPLPGRRNEYRSVRAHFAPQVEGREPGRLDLGLFALGNAARAACLYFGPEGFVGQHTGYGAPLCRMVAIIRNAVCITDFWQSEKGNVAHPLAVSPNPPPYSPGYGIQERRPGGDNQ